MAHPPEVTNMAVFCDFENVALGVRDAKYDEVRHRQGARAAAAERQHRREEGLLRLGPLQGFQGADARGVVRADRDSARAHVGQELRRHPHGRRRARPLLHEGARRHVRDRQRRLRFLAARLQAAREQQDRDRRRREEVDLGSPDGDCDEFIFYDDLVREKRRSGAKTAARAPAGPPKAARSGRRRSAGCRQEERRGATAGSARPRDGDDRSALRRARRGREDLGLDGQAGAEAPQARASTRPTTASARSANCSRKPSGAAA